MDAILESHIAAALGRDRAPADGGRTGNQVKPQNNSSAWQKDYGARSEQEQKACVDASRLAAVGSGDSDGDGGSVGKDRLVNGDRRLHSSLWSQMNEHLCGGTKVFAVCLGVVAFIAVV